MKIVGREDRVVEATRRRPARLDRPLDVQFDNRKDHTTILIIRLSIVGHAVDRIGDYSHDIVDELLVGLVLAEQELDLGPRTLRIEPRVIGH